MTSGGARSNSGPPADPTSTRSKKRGIVSKKLPAEGYAGPIPEFPLPLTNVQRWEQVGQRRFQVVDVEATQTFRERELALWDQAWRWPAATVWASQPQRQYIAAMWVRTAVICEGSESTAADKGAIHRFADGALLTDAGLAKAGYSIADPVEVAVEDEPANSAESDAAPTAPVVDMTSARGRLRR